MPKAVTKLAAKIAERKAQKADKAKVKAAKLHMLENGFVPADFYRIAGSSENDILRDAASDVIERIEKLSKLQDADLEVVIREPVDPADVYIAELILSERTRPEEDF